MTSSCHRRTSSRTPTVPTWLWHPIFTNRFRSWKLLSTSPSVLVVSTCAAVARKKTVSMPTIWAKSLANSGRRATVSKPTPVLSSTATWRTEQSVPFHYFFSLFNFHFDNLLSTKISVTVAIFIVWLADGFSMIFMVTFGLFLYFVTAHFLSDVIAFFGNNIFVRRVRVQLGCYGTIGIDCHSPMLVNDCSPFWWTDFW